MLSLLACTDDPLSRLEPRIEVQPRALDLGVVGEGRAERRGIEVRNVGAAPLEIARVTWTSTSIDLGLAAARPARVLPGTSTVVEVVYAPVDRGEDRGLLTLASNDPIEPEVEVAVRGRVNLAPRALAWGCPLRGPEQAGCVDGVRSRELSAALLARVRLDGRESVDEDGAVTAYRFVLVARPESSRAIIFHSTEDLAERARATGELQVDRVGWYDLRLIVTDDQGLESLDRPESHVALRPRDLEVRLEWDVPGDLDLHLVRPGGRVGDFGSGAAATSTGSDCSAYNRSPDWGEAGSVDDDPSLDRDEVSGRGPEVVSLERPEGSGPYRVFVHACDSRETGVSAQARIEVSVRGERILTVPVGQGYPLLPGELWEAAQVVWDPEREVATVEATGSTPVAAPGLCRLARD